MQTKAQLVTNRQIEFGTFHQAIETVNLIDAKTNPNFPTPRWWRNLRLKEFQAVQGGDERFFYNIALFNAKLSAFAQVRVFDILQEKHYVYEQQLIPTQLNIPDNVLNSINSFSNKKIDIRIENKLRENRITVKFKVLKNKEIPAIEGQVHGNFTNSEHFVASVPFGENHGMYAHKNIVPMHGFLRINEDHHEFKKKQSFFILDDHKGYYPYRLEWDWTTAAFIDERGLIGLNLTKNQSIDGEKYNENALWLGGKIHRLPAITFDRNGDIWTIKDKQGRVNLTFHALYPKAVKINLGPLGASDCEGPFGRVSGDVFIDNQKITFDNIFAFAERMYIRC